MQSVENNGIKKDKAWCLIEPLFRQLLGDMSE